MDLGKVVHELVPLLEDNESITTQIGSPIELGKIRSIYGDKGESVQLQYIGNVGGLGDDREADIIFSLRGPKGHMLVYVKARVKDGEWLVSGIKVFEDGKYSGPFDAWEVNLTSLPN